MLATRAHTSNKMWLLLPALLAPALALRTSEPPPPARTTRNEPIEGWVDVRLNHFDASNTETFPMRYYYNSEVATSNNIVIFVGGEWEISPGWVTGGLAYELAQDMSAGIFYTEHRYYGLTRPTQGTSVEELRHLTVDQALADLAQFIQYVKSERFENGRYSGGKVALVGCSYAGSMATWMRLAYPHVVDAAFSDSGPLHAQEDFPEYLEVITEALRSQGSEECVATVQEGMDRVVSLLTTAAGAEQVSNMFSTCTSIDMSNPMDVATFFWFGVTETFAYLVQPAAPGDIARACSVLTDPDVSDAAQRLANWVTSQSWTQPCIESRYSQVLADHTNTSYDAPDSVMRLWTYQTCVEFGWYQTTSGAQHPFLSTVPLGYFHQMCADFFSTNFSQNFLQSGIERTNVLFAGLTHLPDLVVSVAGAHDPWSPMGPHEGHAIYMAPVYVIPEASHCNAIRPTNPNEDSPLETTKRRVLAHMRAFVLDGSPARDGAAPRAALPAALLLLALAACAALL